MRLDFLRRSHGIIVDENWTACEDLMGGETSTLERFRKRFDSFRLLDCVVVVENLKGYEDSIAEVKGNLKCIEPG